MRPLLTLAVRLPESARALIGAGADATLVTLDPDGSPQATLVWVALRSTPDGDELVTAHLGEYRKVRNVRRDGRVTATILSPELPKRDEVMRLYLSLSGTARIVEGGAPELLTELNRTLAGPDSTFPPPDSPPGLLTRIRIEKIGGVGPWAK